jgi:hypothetical protein
LIIGILGLSSLSIFIVVTANKDINTMNTEIEIDMTHSDGEDGMDGDRDRDREKARNTNLAIDPSSHPSPNLIIPIPDQAPLPKRNSAYRGM